MLPYFNINSLLKTSEEQTPSEPIYFQEYVPEYTAVAYLLEKGYKPHVMYYLGDTPSEPVIDLDNLRWAGFTGDSIQSIPKVSEILVEYTASYMNESMLKSDIQMINDSFQMLFRKILGNLSPKGTHWYWKMTKAKTLGDTWERTGTATLPAVIKAIELPLSRRNVDFLNDKNFVIRWSEQDKSLIGLSHNIRIRARLK